ncbi:MAG TPA: hypothetical protein VKB30_03135, partial [Candidatus Limnocylindrales bacterium]|nr:hypothetical protein [Candidatus Limnocylindrales bacterium]
RCFGRDTCRPMFERIPRVPDRRALVSRAAEGDHEAFAELARAAYQRLCGIARSCRSPYPR